MVLVREGRSRKGRTEGLNKVIFSAWPYAVNRLSTWWGRLSPTGRPRERASPSYKSYIQVHVHTSPRRSLRFLFGWSGWKPCDAHVVWGLGHFTKRDSDNTIKSTTGDLTRIFQERWASHAVLDVQGVGNWRKSVVNVCINLQFLRSRCGPCDFLVSTYFFSPPLKFRDSGRRSKSQETKNRRDEGQAVKVQADVTVSAGPQTRTGWPLRMAAVLTPGAEQASETGYWELQSPPSEGQS